MPTREQTISDAINIFETADYPAAGITNETSWLGFYQVLMWQEPVNCAGYDCLPHIIDADKLRPASPQRATSWTQAKIWQTRAAAVNAYLAQQLGCSVEELPDKTDRLMKLPEYEGMQRQNSLGIAFAGLLKHVLVKFSLASISFSLEVPADDVFPGITFPGRSTTPRMDVLATRNNIPLAIISAKWSVRHDRLNDITNECPVYKAAFNRIYRTPGINPLKYYIVTNEYDPARLNKMLDDTCIDGVVHVHKAAVIQVCGLNGRLTRLMDLADFIETSRLW